MAIHTKKSTLTSDLSPTPTVTTDLRDYAPGGTAIITASGFAAGSTVAFEVEHATGAGADGVWGTPDDLLGTDTGAGHEPWSVTDGGAGDLDGQVNGSVTTSWYVNPDDSAGATFLLTAASAGADRVFGTGDDSVATASFTDSVPGVVATGVEVTLDETAGLQNGSATASPAGDANDNDTSLTLPSAFSGRLATLLAATTPTETLIGAALSGYDGSNTGLNAFTIAPAAGGAITDIRFTDSAGALLNGLDSDRDTAGGVNIYLYTDTTNNNVLLGRAAASDGSADPNGAIVFAAYIEETGSPVTGGKIWTVLYQPLKHPGITDPDDSVNLLNKVFIGTSQDTSFALAGAPSGQNLFLMFTTANPTVVGGRISDVSIIATGKDPADQSSGANITTGDTINTSQAGGPTTFGTNSQMITEQEGIRFTFVTGAKEDFTVSNDPAVPGLTQGEADVEANIDFTAFFGARTATFDVVQLQSGKSAQVKISAFNTVLSNAGEAGNPNATEAGVGFINGYSDDAHVGIVSVTVTDALGGAVAVVISVSGGVAMITGVKAGYKITYTTTSDHNRVLIENGAALNASGNTHADFDIGGFKLLQVSTATAEIGSKIIFEDDGPSISTTGVEPTLAVDETVLATDATANFAANFTSAFGADGAGTLSYALGMIAGASGLTDTATGEVVNLSLTVGGVVEGRTATSNDLVFTVSVAANGEVTLNQIRAVVHPTSDPDEPKSLSADNLVTLTATKTDKDGDSAQATLNIGQNLVFKDDGPSISTNATAEPTLTVDETVLATDATANFAANFTSAFGADGAGTLSYALGMIAGASGLTDTATGEVVNLSLTVGGVVEGRTATSNDLVFTVSVAANGEVTLNQIRAVVHPTSDPDEPKSLSADNLVTLTATKTDKDGDSAQATLNIGQNLVFKDDGPSISTNATAEPTLTVDETVLGTNDTKSFAANFTSAFGADDAGTLSYALGVIAGASGLVDTATGQAVHLSLAAGGVVQGRTAISNELVFTVSVAADGNVTLDQIRAVVHPTSDPDEPKSLSADNLVTLTATKTDKDGDSAQATLNIGQNLVFKDDGPTLAFGNLVGTGTGLAQFGFWSKAAGADGPNADDLQIALTGFQLGGVAQAAANFSLTEVSPSPDGNGNYTWSGSLSGDFDSNGTVDANPLAFTLTALANGKYALDLAAPVQSSTTTDTASGGLGAGGPDPVQTLFIPPAPAIPTETVVFFSAKIGASAASIASGIQLGQPDPTEAGLEGPNAPTTLASFIDPRNMNVSTAGIGVDNNNMNGYGASGNLAVIDDPDGAGNTPSDDSFVINPGTLVDKVRVFIDNSVTGYDYTAGERLQYRTFYADGSASAYTTVVGDLGKGALPKFFEIDGAGQKIDAVQLTMLYGEIKVPNIQFVTLTESLAKDISLDFTASLTDKDGDTVSSNFSADLFTNKAASATFDYELIGTALAADAFDVDLASTRNDYQISGFDTTAGARDKIVLIGDPTATFQINTTGADSIVTIAESGGQTTTVTLVGVELLNTDIVFGGA